MVQLGKKNAKSEDDYGGSTPPLPGRYHVRIEDVDETCEKYDSVIVDFTVLAGNKQNQEGAGFREFFSISDKARDRLSRLAMCVGLLQSGEEKDVNFNPDAIGKHLIVEVEEREYEKDGEKKTKIGMTYAGMWSLSNRKVANVPRDANELKAAGYATGGGQEKQSPPAKKKPSGEDSEHATEAASIAAENSVADDNDWGSLL